ncbi:C-terminal binding protein [Domibacillus indicus]|uniref:C-terminal binding protein n=1 Tax=Domibacillus indicus TaxID=1437523 RepID=UPI00061826D4|nr:C-terminal binding protein [Domibacillus indicus]
MTVIITDCDHKDIEIESSLFNTESIPFKLKQCKTEDEVIQHGQHASVFLNQYAPITEKVMKALPELKLVVRYGVGVNNVDLKAAEEYGVQICNVPDYGTNEVADHALALMLSLTRKIPLMNSYVKKGVWDYQKSIPIFRHGDQTVGIIGLGRIGLSFAHKAHALGCRVIGYDLKEESREIPDFIEKVTMDNILDQSDVISIHCPLDTAYHLIGIAELRKMKETAYLINVSRGGIIDEQALHEALQEKWIAGAASDVAEQEPLSPDTPLLQHENFLCTPHMGWYSEQAALELKRKAAEEAIRFLRNEPVYYPVNQLSNKGVKK